MTTAGDQRQGPAQRVDLALQRRRFRLGLVQHAGDPADLGGHPGGGDHDLAAPAGDRRVHEHHASSGPPAGRPASTGSGRTSPPAAPRRSATTPAPPATAAVSSRPSAGTRSPGLPARPRRPATSSAASSRPSGRRGAPSRWSRASAAAPPATPPPWTPATNPMVALSSTTRAIATGVSHSRVTDQADHRGDQQDDDQQILELAQERPPPRLPTRLGEPVRTVPLEPPGGLPRRQPLSGVHLEPLVTSTAGRACAGGAWVAARVMPYTRTGSSMGARTVSGCSTSARQCRPHRLRRRRGLGAAGVECRRSDRHPARVGRVCAARRRRRAAVRRSGYEPPWSSGVHLLGESITDCGPGRRRSARPCPGPLRMRMSTFPNASRAAASSRPSPVGSVTSASTPTALGSSPAICRARSPRRPERR